MSVTAKEKSSEMLAEVWRRNQPLVLDRIAVLEHAAEAAANDELDCGMRRDATSIAHKLAGSLGMFGLHEGTRLAREIETALESHSEEPAHLVALASSLRRSVVPVRTAAGERKLA
jgi:HPt (histidine-containing phosphotransfer) domain-containing protein